LIPDVLWELTKGFVDLISKLNKTLLTFDDFEKKVDYGQKIKICEKEVGDFTTSKCARNCISVLFFCQKKNIWWTTTFAETLSKCFFMSI